jgi:hypothetical protein
VYTQKAWRLGSDSVIPTSHRRACEGPIASVPGAFGRAGRREAEAGRLFLHFLEAV